MLQQHKLTLPTFWLQDPAGWLQHAEAEFALAHVPMNSYVCYYHMVQVVQVLPSQPYRILPGTSLPAMPDPYLLIKEALLSRFTSLPLRLCFKLLYLLPLCDRHTRLA
jgi:hypothetical protein